MATSRLTKKYQTTLPSEVRKFLGVAGGDIVDFKICNNEVVVKKFNPIDIEYLKMMENTLKDEWNSEEDNAYNEL